MSASDFLATNLLALGAWNPAAAQAIAAVAVPPEWRPRIGTDDTPTFARPGRAPDTLEWLGHTSMPAACAEALIHRMDLAAANGLGIDLGAGFAWRALLARLRPAQMLYVCDDDLIHARLVLTICDLAEPLGSGRLVLLVGPDAGAQLQGFLSQQRGVDPPQIIHPLPTLIGPRRHALISAAETLIRAALTARAQQLQTALAANVPQRPGAALGMLLTPAHTFESTTTGILAAATAEPNPPAFMLDTPWTASVLARVDAIHQHQPSRIISDAFRHELGGAVPGGVPVWTVVPPLAGAGYWTAGRLPEKLLAGDQIICHFAWHQRHLVDRSFPTRQIRLVPLAVDPQAEIQASSAPAPTQVALCADIPNLDAKALGFELDSHIALWSAARSLLAQTPWSVADSGVPDWLRRAQKQAGVRLDDASVEQAFIRGMSEVLLPAMALLATAEMLSRHQVPLKLVGHGWNQAQLAAPANCHAWPRRGTPAQQLAELAEGVAVMVHGSPLGLLHPVTLHAPLAGIALVAPHQLADDAPGGLATLLRPEIDFLRPQPPQLFAAIQSLLRDPARRGALAASARGHLLAHHTWAHRRDLFI